MRLFGGSVHQDGGESKFGGCHGGGPSRSSTTDHKRLRLTVERAAQGHQEELVHLHEELVPEVADEFLHDAREICLHDSRHDAGEVRIIRLYAIGAFHQKVRRTDAGRRS